MYLYIFIYFDIFCIHIIYILSQLFIDVWYILLHFNTIHRVLASVKFQGFAERRKVSATG